MPTLLPSMLTVIVDTREQKPFNFIEVGMKMKVGTLKHADYSIEGMARYIAIERKSPEDFVACMTTQRERFETELLALRGYRYRAIIVEAELDAMLDDLWANDSRNPKRREGSSFGLRSRMKWESAEGTVAAWTIRYCPIVFRRNRAVAERMAQKLIWEAAEAVYAPVAGLALAAEGA